MSRASPLAKFSATSIKTTSLILYLIMLKAAALPTLPAPIIVIIALNVDFRRDIVNACQAI